MVLEENQRLQDQRISNNSQILALMLSTDVDSQRVLDLHKILIDFATTHKEYLFL